MNYKTFEEQKQFENSLKEKISEQIQNKKYHISSFSYSWECFGNVIVEISSKDENVKMKFVSDRGDIYIQNNTGLLGSWKDVECYPNNGNQQYSLLLKAVFDFTN